MFEFKEIELVFRIRTQTEYEAMKEWLDNNPISNSFVESESFSELSSEQLPLLNPDSDFFYDLSANGVSIEQNYRLTNPYPFVDINIKYLINTNEQYSNYINYSKSIDGLIRSILKYQSTKTKTPEFTPFTNSEFEATSNKYPFVKV